MLYTIVYSLRCDIKDNGGKLLADKISTVCVIANDAVNAQNKFLKDNDLAKGDVKILEVRLGA